MTDKTIETKIDALQAVMEARFASHEKEQAGVLGWMERLSNSVERLVDYGNAITALQHRTAGLESAVSDASLDIDALDTRVSDIEVNRKADAVKQGVVSAGIGAAIGAVISQVISKLIGT